MPFCLEKRVALVFADRVRSCNAGDASRRARKSAHGGDSAS